MPTSQQIASAKAAGFVVPVGTDSIQAGDDAITQNAVAAVTNIKAAAFRQGTIPAVDVDLMRGADWVGQWDITNATTANALTGTFPAALGKWLPGQLTVMGGGGGASDLSSQMYMPYLKGSGVWYRTISAYKETGAAAWTKWERMTSDDESQPVTRNAMLVEEFTRRTGPVLTGGRAAIALRFDHGLTNFSQVILPLLRARGLVATVAMNSRNWSLDENSAVTAATADTWADVEFANHSATHGNADDEDTITDEVVQGQAELAAQLPKHSIDGYVIPGTTGTAYLGWGNASASTQFADTYAGRTILGVHAWCSGHIAGTWRRPLDGVLRQGQTHLGIESRSAAATISDLDDAVRARQGALLMMHPRNLNAGGSYLTTEALTKILDRVAYHVKAGAAVSVTMGQLLLADKYTGTPRNTGWQDMTATAAVPITAGNLYLMRDGNTVWVHGLNVKFDGRKVWQQLIMLPAGYRPANNTRIASPLALGVSTSNDVVSIYSTGAVHLSGHEDNTSELNFLISFPTLEPFPA